MELKLIKKALAVLVLVIKLILILLQGRQIGWVGSEPDRFPYTYIINYIDKFTTILL